MLSRRWSQTLHRDVQWKDRTIPVGSDVQRSSSPTDYFGANSKLKHHLEHYPNALKTQKGTES